MLQTLSQNKPVWFVLLLIWLLFPLSTVGKIEHQPQQTIVSQQLQMKLEARTEIQDQCRHSTLCKLSMVSGRMDGKTATGVFALLAGLSVSR